MDNLQGTRPRHGSNGILSQIGEDLPDLRLVSRHQAGLMGREEGNGEAIGAIFSQQLLFHFPRHIAHIEEGITSARVPCKIQKARHNFIEVIRFSHGDGGEAGD